MSNQTLDEILAVFANYDDSYEAGHEEGVLSRIEEAKAAVQKLIVEAEQNGEVNGIELARDTVDWSSEAYEQLTRLLEGENVNGHERGLL